MVRERNEIDSADYLTFPVLQDFLGGSEGGYHHASVEVPEMVRTRCLISLALIISDPLL